jgi:type I restriction enzyme M protein
MCGDSTLKDDVEKFFRENVLPYNSNAWIDKSKDKTGYDIPFTRIFYKFTTLNSSESILKEIKELDEKETLLIKELFSNEG